MAKEYNISVIGHPSIYKNAERNLEIFFTEPERGINSETGIVLLIAGFGGNAESNVYKKMRRIFADKHNLVAIQCNYFGWEFMQQSKKADYTFNISDLEKIFTKEELSQIIENEKLDFRKLIDIGSKYKFDIIGKENMKEDLSDFNDMGIMQAIDNLTALLIVIAIIKDNKFQFNAGKIICYGQSQGAYLSYFSNAFAPNLFSLLIDNSSWILPNYLNHMRVTTTKFGNITNRIYFHYLASKIDYDDELFNLSSLYHKFDNHCRILSFHGTDDELIGNIEKRRFCTKIKNCCYKEISRNEVDGSIFKSTNHGLDADFLELFNYVMEDKNIDFKKSSNISLSNINIETKKYIYEIDYSKGVPILTRTQKNG